LLPEPGEDFTLVPLATPLIAGPGTIGTLMVFAAHMKTLNERLIGGTAALTAALAISTLLFLAEPIGRVLRQKGLQALMKLTGLVLSAISAQLVFAGVKALLSGVTIGMPGSVGSQ
jgi:multiple antibiotic resistance protein